MKGSILKRSMALVCASVIAVSIFAGCGGKSTEKGQAATSKPVEKPYELSMMITSFATEPIKADNPILAEIQKYTNTKLDIMWIPNAAYIDKLNALIAANELPKAIVVPDHKLANIVNGVKSGAFWEVGANLKGYPNLSKANPQVLENISIDGKAYGIYRTRALARDGFVYRKDWLNNLGLKEPTTIDEFYSMVKAFTYNDPDKNGKNDTIGISEGVGMTAFLIVESWFGAPNYWGEQNGKLVPTFMTKEYMDAQKFMKKLYEEKIINQDFAITKNLRDNVNKGKAGVNLLTIDNANTQYGDLLKLDPKAEIDIGSRIKGPKGERLNATSGFNGQYMIPKSNVKTEEEFKKILTFFDKLNDPQMLEIIGNGIEGRHYTKQNNEIVRSAEQNKLFTDEQTELKQLATLVPLATDLITPMAKKVDKMQNDNESIAVHNPTLPLTSQTATEKKATIDKVVSDARIKFVMGELDQAGFEKAIEQWKTSGGDKIIEEYTAEYNKYKKK